jgi:putative transposase
MRGKRFTEEQIIGILKEADAGLPLAELCRKYGMSNATFYNWKAKYGGLTVSEARRLKSLEEENRKLKTIVADLTLDNQALKAVVSKNFQSPK